ncbi:MAG: hypothetical protein IJS50_00555, partial [Desulfovibrio sp.]|nr:hypothetical protein [Desulfovibrio sp.]
MKYLFCCLFLCLGVLGQGGPSFGDGRALAKSENSPVEKQQRLLSFEDLKWDRALTETRQLQPDLKGAYLKIYGFVVPLERDEEN